LNRRYSTKMIAATGLVAAIYAVLTVMLAPISFMSVQFRISEVMILLAFISPEYSPGLILGCAIANLFSPMGMVDVVFGTLSTVMAVWGITHTKKLLPATLWAAAEGLIIGAELAYVFHMNYWLAAGSVALGQFVVVTIIGYPLFKWIMKNNALMRVLKFPEKQKRIEA